MSAEVCDPFLPQGDGATTLAVGDREGKVVLVFPRPVGWVALDPDVAPLVAERMIQAAVACGQRVTIQMPERQVSPAQRMAMIVRAEIVMRQLRGRGKPDDYIAAEVVDVVLKGLA